MNWKQTNGTTPSASDEEQTNPAETGTQGESTDSTNDDTEWNYRCPFCSVSYQDELLTRVHITRSEDAAHLNYNGFMPETEIERISDNNTIVETIVRRPEDVDLSSLTLNIFPSEMPPHHKHILLVAAQNPHESTYTTLLEIVKQRLNDTEFDHPSYSTVRRVIRRFYRPQEESQSGQDNTDTRQSELSAFTAKQQAIIIARALSPEASITTIAEQVDCAPSYPPQVDDQADQVIKHLERQLADADDPETVLHETLTDDELHELIERGLLEDVPITVSARDHHETATEADSEWGSPTEYAEMMSAAPGEYQQTTFGVTDHQEPGEETVERAEGLTGDGATAQAEQPPQNTIPPAELKRLQEQVGFVRAMFDRAATSDTTEHDAVAAVAAQIEQQCKRILRTYAE